jgi:hypothetical protein
MQEARKLMADCVKKASEPVLEKLDAQKRIGLGTNGHDIMVPLKSAAGIIGMHNRNRIA